MNLHTITPPHTHSDIVRIVESHTRCGPNCQLTDEQRQTAYNRFAHHHCLRSELGYDVVYCEYDDPTMTSRTPAYYFPRSLIIDYVRCPAHRHHR